MECRTSLFLKPDKPKQQPRQRVNSSGYSPRTYRRGLRGSPDVNVNKKPPPQDPPVPLPLPKNELMLSLLDSANFVLHNKKDRDDTCIVCVEIQEKDDEGDDKVIESKMSEIQEEVELNVMLSTPPRSTASNKEVELMTPIVPAVSTSTWSSDEEGEDHDAEKTLIALETSLGAGGTYVVIDPNGLDILPYKPKEYIDRKGDNGSDNQKLPAKLTKLNHGDRIQVVDIQDTIVKLARNAGYILATHNQLVKITIPFDNACLIESHLISLQPKYRRLNRMVDKLNAVEEHLLEDLNKFIGEDADYPIFIIPEEEDDIRRSTVHKHVEFDIGDIDLNRDMPPPPPPNPPSYNHPEVIKPNRIDDEEFVTAGVGCTSFFGIGSRVDLDSDSSVEDNTRYFNGIFCPSSNAMDDTPLPPVDTSPTNRQEDLIEQSPPNTARTSTSISPTRTPLPLDAVVSPFVDFRTGRSGHLALTSTKAYPKKFNNNHINIRMMSDHKGIANIKPIHRERFNAPDSPYRGGHRSLSTKTW